LNKQPSVYANPSVIYDLLRVLEIYRFGLKTRRFIYRLFEDCPIGESFFSLQKKWVVASASGG